MLIDTHVHVGQFFEEYYSPEEVSNLMKMVGCDYYAVSSTTMCIERYEQVLEELRILIGIDGEKVLPVMWITPEGLKGNIAWFLESEIKWKCIKIHPFLHKTGWDPNSNNMSEVLDIADYLKVPLLIHTDNDPSCHAGLYLDLIEKHPSQKFILAHGRPKDEVEFIFNNYENVVIDSAFMSIARLQEFLERGYASKILWGTDMCIPKHFSPEEDMSVYYQKKLNDFRKVCTLEQFEQVTYKNAMKLFNLK